MLVTIMEKWCVTVLKGMTNDDEVFFWMSVRIKMIRCVISRTCCLVTQQHIQRPYNLLFLVKKIEISHLLNSLSWQKLILTNHSHQDFLFQLGGQGATRQEPLYEMTHISCWTLHDGSWGQLRKLHLALFSGNADTAFQLYVMLWTKFLLLFHPIILALFSSHIQHRRNSVQTSKRSARSGIDGYYFYHS